MRINRYIASATGMSRRTADKAIAEGRVQVNSRLPAPGEEIGDADKVTLDGRAITPTVNRLTIILNKPAGYVCSRQGQGSKTIYQLLPPELHHLKPVGRLDKDSSGLLLLTNDGELANKLTHPRYQKEKVYEVKLDRALSAVDKASIEKGVMLEDGMSHMDIRLPISDGRKKSGRSDIVEIHLREGRNRQIRRTFAALGYNVVKLRRIEVSDYKLGNLQPGTWLYR